jgi:tetratricopeptide (TPR) repeat protein
VQVPPSPPLLTYLADTESIPTIRCSTCLEWHHRPCVNAFESEDRTFICHRCGDFEPTDAIYEQATAAFKKYLSSNKSQDLQYSLDNFESALTARRAAGAEHPQLAVTLINCANALWARYETAGCPTADLQRVINLNKEALDIWSKITPCPNGYPIVLVNLGNAYFEAYCRNPDREIFQKAISAYQAAREDERWNVHIRNMAQARIGITLCARCDLEKTSLRLDEGIGNLERALQIASEVFASDNMLRALCLASLANAYDVRFQRFNQTGDLISAIDYGYSARESHQTSPNERGASLYNLSRLLLARYWLGKNPKDLDDAEIIAKEAQGMVRIGELKVKIFGVLQAVRAEKQPSD